VVQKFPANLKELIYTSYPNMFSQTDRFYSKFLAVFRILEISILPIFLRICIRVEFKECAKTVENAVQTEGLFNMTSPFRKMVEDMPAFSKILLNEWDDLLWKRMYSKEYPCNNSFDMRIRVSYRCIISRKS
jgi:hypothetical protein